jgi:hypothetical protein
VVIATAVPARSARTSGTTAIPPTPASLLAAVAVEASTLDGGKGEAN